jgi:cytochrome c-type biogenesis protein CcmH/NrfG
VEGHPEDVQARLLLGVALLKAGDANAGVLPLEEVASLGAADTTADARYYLALAHLKRGEEGKARAQLQMISAGGGRWKAEAERLLPKLAGEGGGAR